MSFHQLFKFYEFREWTA